MLAVTDTFICYTVRRSLLRVIHTVSSERALLRGHEFTVVDLKYSANSHSSVLCSVDDGGDPRVPVNPAIAHLNVWKLDDSKKEIGSSKLCSLSLMATIVQPHPTHNQLWAIGRTDHVTKTAYVGVISATDCTQERHPTYESLPAHAVLARNALNDLCISVDGKYVIASVSEHETTKDTNIVVWRLNYTADMGEASYRQSSLAMCFQLPAPYCVAVRGSSVGLVLAAQRPQHVNATQIEMQIQVWPIIPTQSTAVTSTEPTQSIHLSMRPYSVSQPFTPGSEEISYGFTHINFALNSIASNNHALILSHRRSGFVACLALHPHIPPHSHSFGLSPRSMQQQPINHIALINTKAAVESIGCTIIAGRDHHSDEDVSHLELACYQPHVDGQTAVQQFHIPLNHLYNTNVSSFVNVNSAISSNSFLDNLGIGATGGTSSFGGTPINITSLLSAGNMLSPANLQHKVPLTNASPLPVPVPVSTLLSSSTGSKPPVPPVTVPAASADPLLSGLPTLAATDASQGMSLLSMIKGNRSNKEKTPSGTLPSATTNTAAPTITISNGVEQAKNTTGSAMKIDISSTSSTPSLASASVASSNAVVSETPPILSATPPASTATPTISTPTVSTPMGRSIMSMFKTALAPTTASDVNVPASISAPVPVFAHSESKRETESQSQGQQDQDQGGSPLEEDSEYAYDADEITENNTNVAVSLDASMLSQIENTVDRAIQRANEQTTSALIETLSRTMTSVIVDQQGAAGKSSSSSASALPNTQQLSQSLSQSLSQALTQSLKQTVAAETKKNIESSMKTVSVSDELASNIATQLSVSVNSQLQRHVQAAIESSVRDSLKQEMVASFRQTFESSVMPAFQAGTNKMFTQMQAAFDVGMKSMMEEAHKTNKANHHIMQEMKNEVLSYVGFCEST
jgi:hypothetical protein